MSYLGTNFKACYLRRTLSRLIRECYADDKLSIKEFWCYFNIKMANVMFPVLRVFVIRGDSQGRNPSENESRLQLITIPVCWYHGYETMEDEMGGTCRTDGQIRTAYKIWSEYLKEKTTWQN
jgi:hypothetical protein